MSATRLQNAISEIAQTAIKQDRLTHALAMLLESAGAKLTLTPVRK